MNLTSDSTHATRTPIARPRAAPITVGVVVAVSLLAACTPKPARHTRLEAEDLEALVHHMVQSLAASDFLRQRTVRSSPIRIVIDKVENLSSDIVTEAEQWMVMARVRGAMPLMEFSRTKNIAFQITPQRYETLRQAGFVDDLGTDEAPTHAMAATFRSLRRAGTSRGGRTTDLRADTYYLEFRITDVRTRALVWVDEFSFTRQARGLMID